MATTALSPPPTPRSDLATLRSARVAFTGKLATLTRNEAWTVVTRAGGEPCTAVSRRTSVLVVGMNGWPLLADGSVGKKLARAEELRRGGHLIRIISEAAFLEAAGLQEREQDLHKVYSAGQICDMVGVSHEQLGRWEAFGLVRSHAGLYDFQDIVSVRTIAELVARGVRPETIARSLRGLAAVLPGTERPLAQLNIVVENERTLVAERDAMRIGADGQLLLRYDPDPEPEEATLMLASAERTAEDWFEHGQMCEEDERWDEAADAYRRALVLRPDHAEGFFNLGNVLREAGKPDAAAEMYRFAAGHDPSMAAAWYNLAHLHDELGRVEQAVEAYEATLAAAPTYADAHFNLALCYERLGHKESARKQWLAYLELDDRSEYAQVARAKIIAG